MASLPSTDQALNGPADPAENQPTEADTKRHAFYLSESQRTRKHRRTLIPGWSASAEYRKGKPFSSESDNDRVAVNMDWMLTNQKQAMLYSQTPRFFVNHPPQTQSKEFDGWLFKYEQKLNDIAKDSGLETAMDAVIPDCINAAGFGAVIVVHESITEEVEVPSSDLSMLPPEQQQQALATMVNPMTGQAIQMQKVTNILDHRYKTARISPSDFLWDLSFTDSDFNDCPWVGRDGKTSWAEAVIRWKLNPADKKKYAKGGQPADSSMQDQFNQDAELSKNTKDDTVFFTEIFYKSHQATGLSPRSFNEIRQLVYLGDNTKPVIDAQWNGQSYDASGVLIGAQKYPIQVLALHYITDEAIAPSDSAIGRPQVNELNKGRTQALQQREYNRPSRWVDINRIDPAIMQTLLRGEWQVFIPIQGNGQNVIGEVNRAAMPSENFTFDRTAKADLMSIWNLGQGAGGLGAEVTGEARSVADGAQTVIARERARVGKFACNIAEILGGLIAISEDPQFFGEGFDPQVSRMLGCSILIDSTVLLDSKQRLKRIEDFLNLGAKTGWVAMEPVMREYAQLSTLDPSAVIRAPEPSGPEPPNISLRLTGTEDLLQPMTLAFMMQSGQAPTAELIEQAKALIAVSVMPPQNQQAPPVAPGMIGPDGQPMVPNPADALIPPDGSMPPTVAPPLPPPPGVGDAMPDLAALPKINQRAYEA